MPRKLFAGLLGATLAVGTALPGFAADGPVMLAQGGARSAPSQEASEAELKEVRALVAGASSVILPGFGQWVFNDEQPKAVMHFLGAVVLWAIPAFLPIPSPLDRLYLAIPTLFHLYSGYDAYQGAGGKIHLVSQPLLNTWSFEAQVADFGTGGELEHLRLARAELAD